MPDGDVKFVISVDTSTGVASIKTLEESLNTLPTATKHVEEGFGSMAVSMAEGMGIFAAFQMGIEKLKEVFTDSISKANEYQAALNQMQSTANLTGNSFEAMKTAAEGIQNPLLEDAQKMQMLSDLMQRGFTLTQAQTVIGQLGDIAAAGKSAGMTVSDAMDMMVKAFITGRARGEDLRRMFPELAAAVPANVMKDFAAGTATASEKMLLMNAISQQSAADQGALANYLQTTQGAMESVSVAAGKMEEALGRGIEAGIQPLIASMAEAVGGANQLVPTMEKVGIAIGQVFVHGFDLVMIAVKEFGTILPQQMAYIMTALVVTIQKGINDMILSVATTLSKLPEAAQKMIPGFTSVMNGLSAASSHLDNAIMQNTQSLKNEDATITVATSEMQHYINDLMAPAPGIIDKSTVSQQKLGDQLKVTAEALKNAADVQKIYDEAIQNGMAAGEAQAILLQKDKQAAEDYVKEVKVATEAMKVSDVIKKQDAEIQKQATTYAKEYIQTQILLNTQNGETTQSFMKLYDQLKMLEAKYSTLNDEEKAQVAELEAQVSASSDMTAAEVAAVQEADAYRQAQEKMNSEIEKATLLMGIFAQITDMLGGTLGKVASIGEGAMSGLIQALQAGGGAMNIFNGLVGGATDAIEKLGGAWKGVGEMIKGGTNLAEGLMSGNPIQIIQGITQAVMGLFSALKNLFSHNWGKDVSNQLSLAGFDNISADLQKKITDLAKKIGDANTAVLLSLGDIANEVGITSDNFMTFYNKAHDLFSALQGGFITTAQAADVLGQVFPKLVAAGDAYRSQIVDLINLSKQFGLNVQAISDYISQMSQQAVDALGKMIDDYGTRFGELFKKLDEIAKDKKAGVSFDITIDPQRLGAAKAQLKNLEDYTMAVFAQMVDAGKSMPEIFSTLGPEFQKIADWAKKMGIELPEGFKKLIAEQKEFAKDKSAIDHLNNLTNLNKALFSTGDGTIKMFHNLEGSIHSLTDKFGGMGHISHDELAQMAGGLQEAYRESVQLGIPMDANTKRLYDMAVAQGLIKPDPMQAMSDAITQQLIPAIDEMVVLMGGTIPAAANTASNAVTSSATTMGQAMVASAAVSAQAWTNFANGNYTPNVGTPGSVGHELSGGGGTAQRHADLAYPLTFSSPQHIIVDPGETLLPSPQNDRSGNRGMMGGNTNVTININGVNKANEQIGTEMEAKLRRFFADGRNRQEGMG